MATQSINLALVLYLISTVKHLASLLGETAYFFSVSAAEVHKK